MTIITTEKDVAALTLTFVAEFDAPATRVWQVWEDPRQLERWWGPPTYPATFVTHEFTQGGSSTYFMTGPAGEQMWGWWRLGEISAPRAFSFEDGFATEGGEPDPSIDTTSADVSLTETDGTTRMTVVTHFTSEKHLEQLVEMGMLEGMTLAMGQIDDILAKG